MRRFVLFLVGVAWCLFAATAVAETVWEGSAAMGRYGEFPPSGLYAASNTFPRNSIVEVRNLRNGRRTRVIIAKSLRDPGLFMVLSEEAARELEIAKADVATVRIVPVVLPDDWRRAATNDLAFSPDPEVNPAARAGDANPIASTPAKPTPSPVEPDQPGPQAAIVATPRAKVPADRNEADPESPATNVIDETLAYAEGRDPQKQLFVEPQEQKLFAAAAPAPPLESGQPPASETTVAMEPALPRPPEASRPETDTPEPVAGDPRLETIIASVNPPQTPAPVAPAAELKSGAYYLQVGAYSNPEVAKRAMDGLSVRFPVTIQAMEGARPLYRVLVGPVTEDEKGVVLVMLRSQGFRDAFVRRFN